MASTSGVAEAATRSLLMSIRRSLIHCSSMYVNDLRSSRNSGPVHGQQQHLGFARGVAWCASPRVSLRLAREPLQLLLAARVAEDHVMSGAREERPELAAHQPRTENANSHVASSVGLRLVGARLGDNDVRHRIPRVVDAYEQQL